ncbi:butyrophilin subfamily 1 member A1-like isoform X1 [Denticeps clupeoides]|uniref:butyrophilin subfamily 1 member A1-like isoform X1 n=1 Tax=Denticeps clupeoides TaxID=299321 RepID=UPI0010A514F9|nr:butyrophilin subfamily 1 member A1-like isoform X1 [Denticeps clupeoides]
MLLIWTSFLLPVALNNAGEVPTEPITVQSGSSVVLPCQVSPSFSVDDLGVSWYRPEAVNSPVLHYENRGIQEKASDPRYRGRATLTGDLAKGSVDLALENLTVADNGIYVCYVSSKTWYESAEVTLNIRNVGSVPVLLLSEKRDGQVNVTCVSHDWFPEPTLAWRDGGGALIQNQHVQFSAVKYLMTVSSWMLTPSSERDWISCSVSLSGPEARESRVVPRISRLPTVPPEYRTSGKWAEAIMGILLVLLTLLLAALVLLYKKGFIAWSPKTKSKLRHFLNAPFSLPANDLVSFDFILSEAFAQQPQTGGCAAQETKILLETKRTAPNNTTESHSAMGHETEARTDPQPAKESVKKAEQGVKSTDTGSEIILIQELCCVRGWKVNLTLDRQSAPGFLTVKSAKSVKYSDEKRDKVSENHPAHVLCEQRFSSHQHYWEVNGFMVKGYSFPLKTPKGERQSSYAGVCVGGREPACLSPENGYWVLHHKKGTGLYANTQPPTAVPHARPFFTLGVFLDCEKHTLSFYNVDSGTHLCTFNNIPPHKTLVPLISPGVKDPDEMTLS